MLETLIMMQPKKVRDNSVVDERRIRIPGRVHQSQVQTVLNEQLSGKTFNQEKALLTAMQCKPKAMKTINELMRSGGR